MGGGDEDVSFIGTLPLKDGVLKAHGDGGFRMTVDIPEDELPAYIRLHLYRGRVLRFTVKDAGLTPAEKPKPARKRKAKGEKTDDGTAEDRDRYFES